MLWFKPKLRLNNKSNSNKQSAKGGAIKNSTINVGGSNDSSMSVILGELFKITDKIDKMEIASKKIHKAFNLYVQNNGVKPEVKKQVKLILEL